MKEITQQWLDFAKADLTVRGSFLPNLEMTNIITFHAQQAVEKCFKAIEN
jgi:HEPN domain-containing protein